MMVAMASPVIDPLELTKTLVAEIKGKNSGYEEDERLHKQLI